MDNEAHFFERMQQGDWTAFNLFFKEYTEQMYLYAVAFVKERGAAEDIVQDVFIYFWTHRSRIRYTGSVYAWLLSAVKNACVNYKIHQEVEAKYRRTVSDMNEEQTVEAEWEEKYLRLMKLIGSLPPRCREIFVLGAMEGLKYQEIAAQLGVSINTVKTQMKYAWRKVKGEAAGQDMLLFLLLYGKNWL